MSIYILNYRFQTEFRPWVLEAFDWGLCEHNVSDSLKNICHQYTSLCNKQARNEIIRVVRFEHFAMHKPECRSYIDRYPSWKYVDMELFRYWSNSSKPRVISHLTWSSSFALNLRSAPQPSHSSSIRASTSRYGPQIQFKSSETNQRSRVSNARDTGKPVPQSFESIDRSALQQSQKRLEVLSPPYPLLSFSNSLGLGTRWEGGGRGRRVALFYQSPKFNAKDKSTGLCTPVSRKNFEDIILWEPLAVNCWKPFKAHFLTFPRNCLHMKVTILSSQHL